jgi:hypothetical protein
MLKTEKRPVLRGTLIAVFRTWWRGPGEDVEHKECRLAVYCPWCDRLHYHGWDPRNDGHVLQHRAAHCDKESPLSGNGYWISTIRRSEPGYAAHVVCPGQAIERPRQAGPCPAVTR